MKASPCTGPHVCPVCGYPDLQRAPWRGTSAFDEVCPSCGTHFGFDDAAGGKVIRRRDVYVDLRARWKSKGCPWFLQGTQPSGWNPIRQLRRVEDRLGAAPAYVARSTD